MCLLRTPNWGFFVRCAELVPCPCCGEQLVVIGSRKRKYRTSCDQTKILVIRRMRCSHCNRIHHELPDCLIPYKRYESQCVEQVITNPAKAIDTPADEATLYRWRSWYQALSPYLLGCLRSISIRFGQDLVESPSVSSLSVHQRIGRFVGDAQGWLARIVRPIANLNLWYIPVLHSCPNTPSVHSF